MRDLDSVRDTYLVLRDCYTITSELVSKSTKGTTFHESIFWGQPLEEARRRLAQAKAQLDDWAIVALVSVFEGILFEHLRSPLRGRARRERIQGLQQAIEHFAQRVSPRVFEDVERLCRYRDWIAHGKRWAEPASADPISSHQRLSDFLNQAGLVTN